MEADTSPRRLANDEQFSLGGHVYEMVHDTSFEQDLWVMGHIHDARLYDVDAEAGMTATAIALITKAYRSGHLFAILAGLLVEENTRWSPEQAAIIADRFRRLTDPKEKMVLQSSLVGVLERFFVSAVSSLKSSGTSSADARADATPSEDASANGMPSSAPSPDTIPHVSTPS